MAGVVIRRAVIADVQPILELVNELARRQVMLPRSPGSVVENIRDFVVAEEDGAFRGCGALHVVWTDLAEIRSIAVDPEHHTRGLGRRMAEELVSEARTLGIAKLFAFTYVPGFFQKLEFRVVEHASLPHKVFGDCRNCPKFMACDEIAMLRVLDPSSNLPELAALPILNQLPVPQAAR